MRATQKKRMSYPVSITLVGWNIWKSGLCFRISSRDNAGSAAFLGSISVDHVQSAEENQVSRVSASCSHPFPGESAPICIASSLYQTGTLCPHQIWRLMHQSRRLSIQWKYVLSKRSGMIVISP